jgi:HAE1 family hydrophobic/amphiphilic exporter-1
MLIDRIIRRPVTVVMLSLLVIGFGLFALSRLKITLYPQFDIPVVAISTGYRNVSPEDMLRLLVEPIEAAVGGIPGVESIEGNAGKGSAFITMRLKPGTNARQVELDAREQLDRIRNNLPREAASPVIFQFDPENFPIMRLSLQASNRGLDELRALSVELVEPLLERIPGVASSETRGGLQRTVYVDLDPGKMAAHRVTTAQIEAAIRQNNIQIPVGSIVADRLSYNVRAMSAYETVEEIGQTVVVTSEPGMPVRVRDVARVEDGFLDVSSLEEVNGRNSVTIDIQKRSDANTLDVSQGVEAALPDIESKLPAGVSVQVLTNDGSSIESQISNLAQSALIALGLVVLILLLFLGGWRSSTVVALSIPISITATFACMYALGLTLNFVSITGLALAVGLLVDSSIVVLESIVGKLEDGETPYRAVVDGTREVVGALWGSTLTTLVVFIPFLFVTGQTAVFTYDLAVTISLAISFSFLASIILIPVFASKLLRPNEIRNDRGISALFMNLEKAYGRSLTWALLHKRYMLVLIAAVFYGVFHFNGKLTNIFFPSTDSGSIIVNVELPAGSTLVQTAETIRTLASDLQQDSLVAMVIASIGQGGWRSEAHVGRITVRLVDADKRARSSEEIALDLRRRIDVPGVRTSIFAGGGFGPGGGGGRFGGLGQSIRVTMIGPDTEVLKGITTRIEEVMLQDSSVISVDNPRISGTPELNFQIDRQLVSRMGSNIGEVANAFKTQARGTQVGFYRTGGREVPIEVRTDEPYRQSLSDLRRFELLQVGDQRVPVAQLGVFQPTEGVNRISRRDRETIMDVNISVTGDPTVHRERITRLLQEDVVLPPGYRFEFTGTNRDQQQANQSLFYALLAGLLLTYMVMAGKFENFRDPFVIMFTIPLAFFGSFFLFWLTGTNTSVPAYLGMIILVGIVINNGIVMVDFIHQKADIRAGDDAYLPALIQAAKDRLRPIVLTALTTIGSMVPLAMELGTGAETWSPLAKAVIGGLAFSTVFTLYVVPVVLVGISKKRRKAVVAYRKAMVSSLYSLKTDIP